MNPEAMASTPRVSAAAVRRLRRLYREIHECERCLVDSGCRMLPDDELVMRRVIPRAAASPLFVVGQALGPDTQRRSGLPYTNPSRDLSPTGRALDRFLRMLGFTIDPSGTLPYAYSSDIVQRYPGLAAGGGDRRPTPREVANCAEWLDAELHIVQPRVILLLGKQSAKYFLRAHGQGNRVQWGEPRQVEIDGCRAIAFAVYHPAYRRRKPEMVDALYARVARKARRILTRPERS
jgi:uracil-DNA glycosylase family 4